MTSRIPQAKRQECIRLRAEQQLSTPEIARIVGLCNFSVYHILRAYPWCPPKDRDNRRVTRGKRWTEADAAYLRTAYPLASREKIMARLSGRTWEQISKMANAMGIKRKPLAVNPPKRCIHPICAQLRQSREFQGLSRPQLSALTGLHVGDIHTWETGKAKPTFNSFLAWVAGLGLELSLAPVEQDRREAA